MSAKRTTPPPDDSFGLGVLRPAPEDSGLSLDQLSAALADMLEAGDDPYEPEPAAVASSAAGEAVPPSAGLGIGDDLAATDAAADAACEINPRTILEAMLFVGGGREPLGSQQVARLMRGVRAAEIDALVRDLNATYAARRCPYTIVAEGAGYRLQLREEFDRLRDKFYGKARQARLSQAAIEVLSLVAYHEPLSADEINSLRGKASGPILAQLVRRQLLLVERPAKRGEPRRYATTPRFLTLFGLDSLADLPRSNDLDSR